MRRLSKTHPAEQRSTSSGVERTTEVGDPQAWMQRTSWFSPADSSGISCRVHSTVDLEQRGANKHPVGKCNRLGTTPSIASSRSLRWRLAPNLGIDRSKP